MRPQGKEGNGERAMGKLKTLEKKVFKEKAEKDPMQELPKS